MNARCFGALSFALAITGACSEATTVNGSPEPGHVAFSAENVESANLAAELSFRHLYENEPEILDGVDEIWAERVHVDSMGMAHTRIQQTVNGIPVAGGQAIVHLASNGELARVTDNLVRNLEVDTEPVYDRASSVDIALQAFGNARSLTHAPEAKLVIFRHEDIDHLAWRIQLRRLDGTARSTMPLYFIDAHTGAVILHYDNLHTTLLSDGEKRTLDMEGGTSYGAATLAEPSDDIALQAHTHAGHAIDYYQARYGRNSYDDDGTKVKSYVHYGSDYVNAFWDGERLTYGDGDGSISGPLTVLDVVAHEFTHAVTSHTADLTYYGESGALNEATSDIMAAAIEAEVDEGIGQDTWRVGEDCWLAGDALRFMNDPTRDGSSRDHYNSRYNGSGDNGGVHVNSGIGNLFFYLLTQGGQHPKAQFRRSPVEGIGIDAASDIWYRALTTYMTSSTDFAGARTATLGAASDLFGEHSDERCQVQNAWAEVGVGSPCTGAAPPAEDSLQNAVPRADLLGGSGETSIFRMNVPAGASDLVIRTTGGTGDVDLYVRHGSEPTSTAFDCRPYRWGNEETCTFAAPPAGTWYVGLKAYQEGYTGVTLQGSYSID